MVSCRNHLDRSVGVRVWCRHMCPTSPQITCLAGVPLDLSDEYFFVVLSSPTAQPSVSTKSIPRVLRVLQPFARGGGQFVSRCRCRTGSRLNGGLPYYNVSVRVPCWPDGLLSCRHTHCYCYAPSRFYHRRWLSEHTFILMNVRPTTVSWV